MMGFIDLVFPALGHQIPTDHAYSLYSAISKELPEAHDHHFPLAISAITGQYLGDGLHQLTGRSAVRVRLPAEKIPVLLPLAGKALDIAGNRVRLGVPRVAALVPASSLLAHMVTIKNATEPAAFLAAAREKLAAMDIKGEPAIPLIPNGSRAGQPRRRVLRIKGKRVIGYSLQVAGLTAEESILLQEQSDPTTAFSRRKLGCAYFVPLVPRR